MMKRTTLFLAALLCFLAGSAVAQPLCGSDHSHQQQLASNPAYAANLQQFSAHWLQQQQNNPNATIIQTSLGLVYEIPVVIHVIHTGGAVGTIYNPTDATLTGMINYLNQVYRAQYASYPDSLNGGTYFPIRFTLAKRDPNCVTTTGINRVNGSGQAGYTANGVLHNGSVGASEAAIKSLSIYPNTNYYNIWVVNKIDGEDGTGPGSFVAGYAYYPGAPATLDGTIMLATQAYAGSTVLPHEIGHAFNLAHTFDGGTTSVCPPNTNNCLVDNDQVCDTEPVIQSFACPNNTVINTCTNAPYNNGQYNIMGYSSCANRFTLGQRARFFSSLFNQRPSLISSLGATALGGPASATPTCVPTITNPANTNNAGPRTVKVADMTSVSGGYNTDGNQVYVDRTCQQGANMNPGQTYSISVTTGGQTENVRAYIDYNNDGSFSLGELIFTSNGTTTNQTHTGTFIVQTTGIVTCVPIRMRVVSDRAIIPIPPSPCGALGYGQAEDFRVQLTGSANAATISIALTSGTNPSCIGTPLTFTATTTGAPSSPTYKWFVNGTFTGTTAITYNSSALVNNDVVTARLYYAGSCGSDSSTSAPITVQRTVASAPSVSIALTSGQNPGCAGQTLVFTATPTNGGTTPTYTWQVKTGGVWTTQPGQTTATFTTSTLANGDSVRSILNSSSTCATVSTATSNAIGIQFGATLAASITIAQTAGTNPSCAGRSVTFTATPVNGGMTGTITWTANGTPTGATGTTFTSTSLGNHDTIRAVLNAVNPCVTNTTATSNAIILTILPSDTPKVNVAITVGTNPGCKDSLLGFTATGTGMGNAPVFTYYRNGLLVNTGPAYATTTLLNGDVITVRAVTGGPGCRTTDTAFSAPINIVRINAPGAPIISYIATNLVADSPSVQWYGPAGLIPGATSQSYYPTVPGLYYAVANNGGCFGAKSNTLLVSTVGIAHYNLNSVRIFPNPTSGTLSLQWTAAPQRMQLSLYNTTGQGLLTETLHNTASKTLNLNHLPNGIYYLMLQDESGATAAVRVTVSK